MATRPAPGLQVVRNGDRALTGFTEAVREHIERMQGLRGDPLDRVITLRDLQLAGCDVSGAVVSRSKEIIFPERSAKSTVDIESLALQIYNSRVFQSLVAPNFELPSGTFTYPVPPPPAIPPGGDPPYFRTQTILHFEDGNGATTFNDNSYAGDDWVAYGPAAVSTSQSLFGTGALYLPGTAGTPGFAWRAVGVPMFLSDREFGIEFSFRSNTPLDASTYLKRIMGMWRVGYLSFGMDYYSAGLRFFVATSPTDGTLATLLTYTVDFAANTWYRIGVFGDATNFYLFVDGILVGTAARVYVPDAGGNFVLGALGEYEDGSLTFGGYFDEFRFAVGPGSCVNIADYLVHTGPFPDSAGPGADPYYANVSLLLYGNGANGGTTFVDLSPTPKTVSPNGDARTSTAQSVYGGSSILLDGSGDYLSAPAHADFDFGSGDFTAEMYFRLDALSDQLLMFYGQPTFSSTAGFSYGFDCDATGKVSFFLYSGTTAYTVTTVSSVTAGVWAYVSATRSGSNLRIFLNGALEATLGTAGVAINAASGRTLTFGRFVDIDLRYMSGHQAMIRLTKGVARETATYTPGALPFPDTGPVASSTKWQLSNLDVTGTYLEISELQLYEGATQATGATLTSNYAVSGGFPISYINDGNTSNRAYWSAADANMADFVIEFEFASSKTIDGIRFAGFDTADRFSTQYTLKYWNGTSWVTAGTVSGLTYPGNNTYSSVIPVV